MDWEQIRAHFVRVFRESGRKQEEVATAAGINQNLISKLMRNRRDGPRVATLLRALDGLGVSPAAFFAGIEQAGDPAALIHLARARRAVRDAEEIEHLERFRRFGQGLRAFEQVIRGEVTPPAAQAARRRSPRSQTARRAK